MKKHTKRRVVAPIPPMWRPRITKSQQTALEVGHLALLDAIVKGDGTLEVALQWAGAVYTWRTVAQILDLGIEEMAAQVVVLDSMIDRYRKHGRIGFSGPEYQAAKDGVDVMAALAERADRFTAIAAAEAGEVLANKLEASLRELQKCAA
jgi:hypothetical protein